MIYGRRPRQLFAVWGVSFAGIGLIYWLEYSAPALHELVQPFYWIILALATVAAVMLQGPYAAGAGIGDAVKWTVVHDVLTTRFGHVTEVFAVDLERQRLVAMNDERVEIMAGEHRGVVSSCSAHHVHEQPRNGPRRHLARRDEVAHAWRAGIGLPRWAPEAPLPIERPDRSARQ